MIGIPTHVARFSLLSPAGQQKSFTPKKYFSIDRVFRNETLDATHLAEFHQIEGLVADYDLTLADLIGVITQFFQKWGNASCVSCVRASVCVCVCGMTGKPRWRRGWGGSGLKWRTSLTHVHACVVRACRLDAAAL